MSAKAIIRHSIMLQFVEMIFQRLCSVSRTIALPTRHVTTAATSTQSSPRKMHRPTLLFHAGCANHLPSAPRQNEIETALRRVCTAGSHMLERGASAIDTVVATVASMEDCELFNAGKGAVMTAQGDHEVMEKPQRYCPLLTMQSWRPVSWTAPMVSMVPWP